MAHLFDIRPNLTFGDITMIVAILLSISACTAPTTSSVEAEVGDGQTPELMMKWRPLSGSTGGIVLTGERQEYYPSYGQQDIEVEVYAWSEQGIVEGRLSVHALIECQHGHSVEIPLVEASQQGPIASGDPLALTFLDVGAPGKGDGEACAAHGGVVGFSHIVRTQIEDEQLDIATAEAQIHYAAD